MEGRQNQNNVFSEYKKLINEINNSNLEKTDKNKCRIEAFEILRDILTKTEHILEGKDRSRLFKKLNQLMKYTVSLAESMLTEHGEFAISDAESESVIKFLEEKDKEKLNILYRLFIYRSNGVISNIPQELSSCANLVFNIFDEIYGFVVRDDQLAANLDKLSLFKIFIISSLFSSNKDSMKELTEPGTLIYQIFTAKSSNFLTIGNPTAAIKRVLDKKAQIEGVIKKNLNSDYKNGFFTLYFYYCWIKEVGKLGNEEKGKGKGVFAFPEEIILNILKVNLPNFIKPEYSYLRNAVAFVNSYNNCLFKTPSSASKTLIDNLTHAFNEKNEFNEKKSLEEKVDAIKKIVETFHSEKKSGGKAIKLLRSHGLLGEESRQKNNKYEVDKEGFVIIPSMKK